MDAVLVAAAIHWLDVDRFNREALRVLKPKGLLVWLGYQPIEGAPTALQSWLEELYHQRLRSFWPPQRVHVDRRYTDLIFPFSQPNHSGRVCDDRAVEPGRPAVLHQHLVSHAAHRAKAGVASATSLASACTCQRTQGDLAFAVGNTATATTADGPLGLAP